MKSKRILKIRVKHSPSVGEFALTDKWVEHKSLAEQFVKERYENTVIDTSEIVDVLDILTD